VPQPGLRMRGQIVLDGVAMTVDDWPGSQNHNWGRRHTDRYAWGQVAGFDEHQLPRHALPTISRSVLAEMCGLTRSTVDRLMNSFRKRGFLERRTLDRGIQIHRSMLSVVLQD